MSMEVPLGLIEGYYGKPWSWTAREETIAFLAPHGYGFYIYAPKADLLLRERWREPHPAAEMQALASLAESCRALGVRFGALAFIPFWRSIAASMTRPRRRWRRSWRGLARLGLDDRAILFDDMRGGLSDLAATQIGIMHWIAERTGSSRLIVCPTYYTDDPILDSGYGTRPEGYLEDIGGGLDRTIEIFWTGEEVCLLARPATWPTNLERRCATQAQTLHLGQPLGQRRGGDEPVPSPSRLHRPTGGHGRAPSPPTR